MNKITSAFSLIELIVVLSIIAIAWFSSISFFWDFSDKNIINQDLSILKQNIDKYDKDIKNMKIYDYKMIIKTWSLAYITYTNYINQDYKALLDFNNDSLTWSLYTNWEISIWTIFSFDSYNNNKLFISSNIDAKDKQMFDFSSLNKVEISSSISWSIVNNVYLDYYSQENSYTWTNLANKLVLTNINTKDDKSWRWFDYIEIENINNKKFIKDKSGHIVDKVFLFFQKWWKEVSLEIN